MNRSEVLHVALDVGENGVSVSWEGATLTISDEELATIRREAHLAKESRDLDHLGAKLWSATLGKIPLPDALTIILEIRAADSDLSTLPWEAMVEPAFGLPAALHPTITTFRAPLPYRGPFSPAPPDPPPLRLLVVHPEWRADEGFAAKFRGALEGYAQATLNYIFVPNLSAAEVAERLGGHRPHAVHWILGGALADGSIEEQLEVIETHLLALDRGPRLLTLTGPLGAGLSGRNDPGILLSRLADRGLEAEVVPAGADLTPFAEAFWSRFYEDLARGETLAEALRRGRNHLCLETSSSPAWAALALYAIGSGVQLVQKERAPREGARGSILAVRSESAAQPFKGLSPYEEEDEGAYFGREKEASEILEIWRRERRLVLFGASGIGKTSLVRAGLLPRLRDEGWAPIYVTPSTTLHADILVQLGVEPSGAPPTTEDVLAAVDRVLAAAGGIVVPIVIDQAEDLLGHPQRRELLRGLLERTREESSWCSLLLVLLPDTCLPLRDDLEAIYFERPVRELEVAPLTRGAARAALKQLERNYGFRFEKGLLYKLLTDLAVKDREGGRYTVLLPQLSLVLRLLWERRQRFPSVVLLFEEYLRIEVTRLLPAQLRNVLELLGESDATAARAVLIHLVDRDLVDRDSRRPQPVSLADLADLTGFEPATVSRVLQALSRQHLGRSLPDGRFQLVHEVLAREICAEFLSSEVMEGEAVRWLIRAHLDRWRDRGALLPPDVLARARRAAGQLVLTAPEQALYLATLILSDAADPEAPPAQEDPLFVGIWDSPSLLESVFEQLRTSRNPKALALALQLCGLQGPVRRGFSPIDLAAPRKLAPHARFLSEALVETLPQMALGISSDASGRNQNENDRQETLELLAETKLLRQPAAAAIDKNRERILKVLGGGPLGMLSPQRSSLALWPGPWIGGPPLFLAAVLLASPISHALWPAGGQGLAELEMIVFLAAAILFSARQFVQDLPILQILQPALGVPSVGWASVRGRLLPVLRTTAGVLSSASVLVCIVKLVGRFSGWLHHSFFTVATVRGLWTWLVGLPGSLIPWVLGLASGVQEFFLGIPLLGSALRWLAAIPDGADGLWWLLLSLGSWAVGAFLAAFSLLMALGLSFAFPGLVLFPPAVVVVTGCVTIDRILFGSPGRRPFRWVAETMAASVLVGLALPWTMGLSRLVLAWASPYLWRPEVFYGQGRLEALAAILQRLSLGPFPIALGSTLPLGMCLAIRALGWRPLRLVLAPYTTWGRDRPRERGLWPLWAEGTRESLGLFFKLVRKRPSTRGPESFAAAWLVAIGDGRVPPAGRTDALADEAERVLWLFEPASWHASWLSALRELAGEAENEARVERLQSLLRRLEERRAAVPAPSSPASPMRRPRWIRVLQILGMGLVTGLSLLLFLFAFGLLLHFGRMIVTRLADLLFPLGVPLATPASNLAGTFAWVVRFVEFLAFGGLFALLVGSFILLARFKRRAAT